jgi:hypothetical protein
MTNLVLTNTTMNQDQAIESSVLGDMFIKGHYQRPNDTNHTLVPISTIKDSIIKQMKHAKKSFTLPTPRKAIELSGGLVINQKKGLNWLQPSR